MGAKRDGVLDSEVAKTDQPEIDLKASAAVEGDSVTVKQLCDLFLSGKDRQVQTGELSPATFRGYLQHGKLIAKFFGKDKQIADLQPKDFESLKAHMVKTKPQKRNGKTVQRTASSD